MGPPWTLSPESRLHPCASNADYLQSAAYRVVSAPGSTYPRIGNIWIGGYVFNSAPDQAQKTQLALGAGGLTAANVALLRAPNPSFLNILSVNVADNGGEGSPPDAYFLKDVHGTRLRIGAPHRRGISSMSPGPRCPSSSHNMPTNYWLSRILFPTGYSSTASLRRCRNRTRIAMATSGKSIPTAMVSPTIPQPSTRHGARRVRGRKRIPLHGARRIRVRACAGIPRPGAIPRGL